MPRLAQPFGSTSIEVNKQSIARNFGIGDNEVCYAKPGQPLTGYKAIYDKATQRAYYLPTGLTGTVTSISTTGILTHSAGTVDLGALAVIREEYVTLPGSFTSGATLNVKNELLVYLDSKYRWGGAFPKTIPANSSPASTGGESETAWVNVSASTLRTDLAATGGVNLVSNAQGFFDTVMAASATQLKNGSLYNFKGRSTANDGGGGLFRYDATSTATVDNGVVFSVSGGGRLIRQVRTSLSENQIAEAINVRWFGAKGDAATDDTAAVLAAYNYAKNTNLFYTLLFPAGRYVTFTSFVFQDVTAASFIMDGCVFIGANNGADNNQQAVIEIRNVVNASLSGPCSITTKALSGAASGNPNAYISAFLVRGVPGGILQPELGVAAFLTVSDFTTIRVGCGFRIGEVGNDAQTSEMNFVNCKSLSTLNPVYVAGSQTLASFTGCTLTSNLVDGINNAYKTTIVNVGGAVSVVGGSVEQHSDSSAQMVLMAACKSASYGNSYGQVNITGAVIESTAPLCNVSNIFNYPNTSSFLSKFSIQGNTGGYVGGVPLTSGMINVFDTNYAGIISVPDGNVFYQQLTSSTRTGYNVNASGNNKVRICVGKTAFDTATGLMSYQAGVAGGIMVHSEVLATAANVTSQSVPANTNTVIVWGNNPFDSVRMGRYHYIVNTGTGAITIPDAGVKSVRFEVTATLDAPSTTGNIMLYRNGVLAQYGVLGGGVGNLNATVSDPAAGEIITIRLQISAPSALNSLTKMKIYITT